MPIADVVISVVATAVAPVTVLDAVVTVDPPPNGHVVVYCSEGSEGLGDGTDRKVAGPIDDAMVEMTIHSFAPDRNAARRNSNRLTTALLNTTLVVPGYLPTRVMNHHRRIPSPDTDVPGRPYVMIVDQFEAPFTRTT